MTPITKTQRWLDLIAFLAGRRFPVTFEEVMGGVPAYALDLREGADPESVRRKFERDKDELRAEGIPVETVDYTVGGVATQGYRLRSRDFYLPYLRLLREEGGSGTTESDDEVEVAPADLRHAVEGLHALSALPTFPLREEARSALRKLTFDLSDTLGEGTTTHLSAADPGATRAVTEALTDALQRRKTVTFRYHGITRDRTTRRRVRPYGLLFKFNRWYLVGFDEDRSALRTFRVSRMDAVRVNPRRQTSPDFEVPDDLDLDTWSRSQAWDLPGDDSPAERVTVRFEFPRSLWAERNGHGEAEGEPADDGSRLRAFTVRQAGPFLRWLLSLEGDATVVEPTELQDRLEALAERVVDMYDDGASRG